VKDKEYYVSKTLAYWYDAWALCQMRGLEFMSLDSKKEHDLFIKFFPKHSSKFVSRYVLIGAIESVQGNASSFVWVATNQNLRYNLTWQYPNPDNYKQREACLSIVPSTPTTPFNDIDCDFEPFSFICQKTNRSNINSKE